MNAKEAKLTRMIVYNSKMRARSGGRPVSDLDFKDLRATPKQIRRAIRLVEKELAKE